MKEHILHLQCLNKSFAMYKDDDNKLKRKALKLCHPNPLFEKWLQELRENAVSKNSDTQYAFAKALSSLKKYPLPLKSGKECMILEHFGTRICMLLDRKLADYKSSNSGIQGNENLEAEQTEVKKEKKMHEKPTKPIKKTLKNYVPTLRSASYAVLLALKEYLKEVGPPGEMSKSELQKAAQPLCDTSMYKPMPGSHYSGWSCVGQLVCKQLVQRTGNPHRYKLTEEGINLAEKLPLIGSELQETVPCSLPNTLQIEPKQPSTRNENRKLNTENIKSLDKTNKICPAQVTSFPEDTVPEDIEYLVESLSKNPKNTQSDKNEEFIFLPGTFSIVLLVDTQEIHKGDELVKALEAQGVTLEVRKLNVGDFSWVSRNADGQELLLPYIIERKRLDDLASSIKDGRFHEQKFRMKQSGVPNCIYLVESHGQRQFCLPTSTLLQAAANTQFIDRFTVKYTASSHETVIYLASLFKAIARRFSSKTLLGCSKSMLPKFNIQDDCISLMSFKEFNMSSGKTRKYSVKEMFIKQLVQLRGLSVEKALAIVEQYPSPRSLMLAFADKGSMTLLTDVPIGNLSKSIGPTISKTIYELYNKPVLT